MRLTYLIQTLVLFFSFINVPPLFGATVNANTVAFVSETASRLNGIYATNYSWALAECSGEGAWFNHGNILLCDRDLELWMKTIPDDLVKSLLVFLLAHEFGHGLLEGPMHFDEYDFIGDQEMSTYLESKLGLDDVSIFFGITTTNHENIDGLASKVLRSLGHPREGITQLFDWMEKTSSSDDLDTVRIRRTLALSAYDEGWKDWKTFRKLFHPCGRGSSSALFAHFNAQHFNKIVGIQDCQFFEKQQVFDTYSEAMVRYR